MPSGVLMADAVSVETQNFASVQTAVSLLALKNGIYYEHILR
jgi:hypothetical protein